MIFFVFLLLILTFKIIIMKKIFTFIFAITLSLNIFAQCPLTTAVDFTATDCHGTEVNLFDILDGGQYVLIDFFFYSCGACNTTAPYMVQAYTALGCNQHDVFFMEISDRDSDALCQTWTQNYGVEYPTISGAAGGAAINDQYMIPAYPTVILIAPDHSIVINDLWPINNAQTVVNALGNHGIQQHECGDAVEEIDISNFTFYPNPVNDYLMIRGENLGNVSVYSALGQVIFKGFATNELKINTSDYKSGLYFVKIGNKIEKFVVNH